MTSSRRCAVGMAQLGRFCINFYQRQESLRFNKRRYRELEQVNGELRRISSQLIKTQDQERRRLARELHDGLGQEFAALKMIVAEIP